MSRVTTERAREMLAAEAHPCPRQQSGRCGWCETCCASLDADDDLRGASRLLAADLIDARSESDAHRTRADAAEVDRDALRAECERLRAENTRLAHLASQTMDLAVERNHYRERAAHAAEVAAAVAGEGERLAADARHAALAGAVRAEREAESALSEALAATNRAPTRPGERIERYEAFCAAERVYVAAHERTDALLRGAPGGYVAARAVASYKAAVERIADLDDDSPESVAAFRAARTALEVALAAATTTPKESL